MLIYAASDFHLGDGSPRDESKRREDDLIRSVHSIPGNARIVLVGDVVDLWRYKHTSLIWRAHLEFFNYFSSRGAIYVMGNHDMDKALVKGIVSESVFVTKHINLDGMLYTHGNMFDLANGRWWKIGRAVTTAGAALGLLSPSLEDAADRLATRIQGTGRHSARDKFLKTVKDFIEDFYGVAGIVCGHTHDALVSELGGKAYVNLGTWAENGWSVFESGKYKGNTP